MVNMTKLQQSLHASLHITIFQTSIQHCICFVTRGGGNKLKAKLSSTKNLTEAAKYKVHIFIQNFPDHFPTALAQPRPNARTARHIPEGQLPLVTLFRH